MPTLNGDQGWATGSIVNLQEYGDVSDRANHPHAGGVTEEKRVSRTTFLEELEISETQVKRDLCPPQDQFRKRILYHPEIALLSCRPNRLWSDIELPRLG